MTDATLCVTHFRYERALVWFRRDLRLQDHAALYHALKSARQVWCLFVFDTDILRELPAQDRRVQFIHACVQALDTDLRQLMQAHGRPDVRLLCAHGTAVEQIPLLARQLQVNAVYFNRDYEPQALERDQSVASALSAQGVAVHTFKDQVIFETDEVLTQTQKPYGVFTPYKNAWLKKITPFFLKAYPVLRYAAQLAPVPPALAQDWHLLPLATMGFVADPAMTAHLTIGEKGATQLLTDFEQRMGQYAHTRDFPSVKGPSYLSVHLRFGTISIRHVVRAAWSRIHYSGQSSQLSEGAAVWLSELVWREFYQQILFHHPHVTQRAYKSAYDVIEWEEGDEAQKLFQAWCEGKTGYPIVDAAMLQLNQTGYMHNRLRMITASFLIKDLGIDWRWGERYFAQQLNDFDLAANNGGWQWCASSGCDAQPYFRIFNPILQSEKFDPQGKFIRRYLPQLKNLEDRFIHAPWQAGPKRLSEWGITLGEHYPLPIVDHAVAKQRTLRRYAVLADVGEKKALESHEP